MKVYIAAPLYCDYEKDYNLKIDTFLRENGFDTYLPQRDGGELASMPDFIDGITKEQYVFEKDLEAMDASDVFLFLLDGRVPDEGACVALGYFYRSGKPCVGLKSDHRCLTPSGDNLMIAKALRKICRSKEELLEYLKQL